MANKLCHCCKGLKKMIGLGMMKIPCIYCEGKGFIDDERETRDDGKQNEIKSAKNTKRKTAVDKGASDNSKGKRKIIRQDTSMGISANDIQEGETSGKDSEEIGCGKDKEEQSGEQV